MVRSESMSTELGRLTRPAPGRAQYLATVGRQLYCVTHAATGDARARVLLLGPLGSERTYAYNTSVRWARTLADGGFDVVRFDYRGFGESTGSSAEASLHDLLDDAHAAVDLLDGEGPLIVHGLRFGALVAEGLRRRGVGDALLVWGRPHRAEDGLLDLLRNHLAAEAVVATAHRHGAIDAMVAELEAGRAVDAEGFAISPRLWHDLKVVELASADAPTVRHLDLSTGPGQPGIRIPRPPFWRPGQVLRPDLDELFRISLAWLEEVADTLRR